MIKYYNILRILLISLTSTVLIHIQSLFPTINTFQKSVIIFIMIFIILTLTDYIIKKLYLKITITLVKIINSLSIEEKNVKTVQQFLTDPSTIESKLTEGDEVHILTNSLENYDLSQPAIDIIAENILKGVKYIYYIPLNFYETLKEELSTLISILYNEKSIDRRQILDNIIFYNVNIEGLYNFAYIKSKYKRVGYWYITTPSENVNEGNNLIIVELDKKDRNILIGIFKLLSKSKKVNYDNIINL